MKAVFIVAIVWGIIIGAGLILTYAVFFPMIGLIGDTAAQVVWFVLWFSLAVWVVQILRRG